MGSTLVYLVRHGQTADNVLKIIQGHRDTELDETGVAQAKEVAEALKNVKFDLAFTSDLVRAVETTNAILHYHPEARLTKSALLRERYMGTLQGKVFDEKVGLVLDDSVEGGAVFTQRIVQFWDEMLIPSVQKIRGERPSYILVVSHGGFISTFARVAMNHKGVAKAPSVNIDWCANTSITTMEIQQDGSGVLQSFGDASHMTAPSHVAVGNADELKTVNGIYHGK